MKGYIQDKSIILTESLPKEITNGDQVEVVITVLKKSVKANSSLSLVNDHNHLASAWDNIPDQIAAELKAEFSTEDQNFAETALYNCSSLSQDV